jgi:hypothetical protein
MYTRCQTQSFCLHSSIRKFAVQQKWSDRKSGSKSPGGAQQKAAKAGQAARINKKAAGTGGVLEVRERS